MDINIIEQICSSEIIYALKNETIYASVESLYENDEDNIPIEAMCIWSSKENAQLNQTEDWSAYQIEPISLPDFLENWCVGMFNDGLVFCLNLDLENDTQEVQPLELANKIALKIQKNKKEINFNKFENISDYIKKIKPFVLE